MTLSEIRSQIDALDQDLLRLLSERVALAREARSLKTQAGDPKREQQIHNEWKRCAKKIGLDEKKIAAVLEAVIDLTRSSQEP